MIKSPIRYPGGKSKVVKELIKYIPAEFTEYREPFVGGGSMYLLLKSDLLLNKYWLNDLNKDVSYFWQCCRWDSQELIQGVINYYNSYADGKSLYSYLSQFRNCSAVVNNKIFRAVRFFIMNRITFSGVMDSGGYSNQAFEKRFTKSSIDRLISLCELLKDDDSLVVSNLDYNELLNDRANGVFCYLDPPYYTAKKLYGVTLVITYDDCQDTSKT
jgi:DNA adenine methylase